MVLETLVYSPLNHVTRLLAREYFIEFSRWESLKLYTAKIIRFVIAECCVVIQVYVVSLMFRQFYALYSAEW
jgi:hypothetical protein